MSNKLDTAAELIGRRALVTGGTRGDRAATTRGRNIAVDGGMSAR